MLKFPAGARARAVRRAAGIAVIPLAGALALAGCSSPASTTTKASSPASTAPGSMTASESVKVTGKFGASPSVLVPKAKAGSQLYVKTVIAGTGQKMTASDSLVGNFVLYDWSGTTAKLLGSTFAAGKGPTMFTSDMLPGLSTALTGQKLGSRVLVVVPPAEGFGSSGNSSIGVKGTDTLVFVVDMQTIIPDSASASGKQVSDGGGALPTVSAVAGKPATITMPKAAAPAALTAKTLVAGTGAKVASGDLVAVQYTGAVWRTGKVFDSSFSHSELFSFTDGAGQVVKGWDTGLAGQRSGSRVMLVIPPADGYGSSGNSQAGITGTDTLVFVIDIVGVYPPTK